MKKPLSDCTENFILPIPEDRRRRPDRASLTTSIISSPTLEPGTCQAGDCFPESLVLATNLNMSIDFIQSR